MPKFFTAKVVTANSLLEGDAVWLTQDDRWTRDMSKAELLTDEAHAELRAIEAHGCSEEVVGIYLADAHDTPEGPAAAHFREAFRARGPSNYPHGKQAEAK